MSPKGCATSAGCGGAETGACLVANENPFTVDRAVAKRRRAADGDSRTGRLHAAGQGSVGMARW